MTPERAQEIWDLRTEVGIGELLPYAYDEPLGIQHPRGITREEDAEIRAQWDRMSGGSSYTGALLHFRNVGRPEPDLRKYLTRGYGGE